MIRNSSGVKHGPESSRLMRGARVLREYVFERVPKPRLRWCVGYDGQPVIAMALRAVKAVCREVAVNQGGTTQLRPWAMPKDFFVK